MSEIYTIHEDFNLPAASPDKNFPLVVYKVSSDWEEFLRNIAVILPTLDHDFQKKIAQACCTMYHNRGIGIAANQVGFKENWCIIDTKWTSTGNKHPRIMINPEIIETIGEGDSLEGCLSVPLGFKGNVKRPLEVKVKYHDLYDNEVVWHATGLDAQAVMHELDHLNGKLFIDHISKLRQSFLENKINKAKKLAKIKIKVHNRNIIQTVKALNMQYEWSTKKKKDLEERANEEANTDPTIDNVDGVRDAVLPGTE